MNVNDSQYPKKAISWKYIVLGVVALLLIGLFIFTLKFLSAQSSADLNTNPVASDVETSKLMYKNQKFGFEFELPSEWRGYSVTEESITNAAGNEAYGTLITVHDPRSMNAPQPLYVPIAIFTTAQWEKWVATNFDGYPTAAPIGPTERGRNNQYVFATPPRFDFGFDELGYKEVNDIILTLKGFAI